MSARTRAHISIVHPCIKTLMAIFSAPPFLAPSLNLCAPWHTTDLPVSPCRGEGLPAEEAASSETHLCDKLCANRVVRLDLNLNLNRSLNLHTHTHTHTHMRARAPTNTHTTCARAHKHTHTHTRILAYTSTRTHIFLNNSFLASQNLEAHSHSSAANVKRKEFRAVKIVEHMRRRRQIARHALTLCETWRVINDLTGTPHLYRNRP